MLRAGLRWGLALTGGHPGIGLHRNSPARVAAVGRRTQGSRRCEAPERWLFRGRRRASPETDPLGALNQTGQRSRQREGRVSCAACDIEDSLARLDLRHLQQAASEGLAAAPQVLIVLSPGGSGVVPVLPILLLYGLGVDLSHDERGGSETRPYITRFLRFCLRVAPRLLWLAGGLSNRAVERVHERLRRGDDNVRVGGTADECAVVRLDTNRYLTLRVDSLGYAVHGVLEELVGHADEAVDGAVGGVNWPRASRRRLRRAAVRADDSHGGGRDRLVAAGDLKQVQLVDLLHCPSLARYERIEVAVVDLALLVGELLEGDED